MFFVFTDHLRTKKKKMTYIFKQIIVSLSLQVKLMKVFYTLHTDINFFHEEKKYCTHTCNTEIGKLL